MRESLQPGPVYSLEKSNMKQKYTMKCKFLNMLLSSVNFNNFERKIPAFFFFFVCRRRQKLVTQSFETATKKPPKYGFCYENFPAKVGAFCKTFAEISIRVLPTEFRLQFCW